MDQNTKKQVGLESDDLHRLFVTLYSIAEVPDAGRVAEEEIANIYRRALGRLMEGLDEEKRMEIQAEMGVSDEAEVLLNVLADNFEAEEVRKQVLESSQVIMGQWFNSTLPNMEHDKVLQMRDILVEFGKKLEVSNKVNTNG